MNVTIITGCASGVGRHLVTAAVQRGLCVVATDIDVEKLSEAAAQGVWPTDRVICQSLDVRDLPGWQRVAQAALDQWGHIDYLFNIAGFLHPGYLLDASVTDIDRHFDINVKGLIYGCQVIGSHMVRQRSGHIVNMASTAGLAPIPGIGLYSASKFAARATSLILAEELREKGVYVSVLCPDAIETPMLVMQERFEEAALTFSGRRPLTLLEIETVIFDKILPEHPLEVVLPFDRGVLAKVANLVPSVTSYAVKFMKKAGVKAQAARYKEKS